MPWFIKVPVLHVSAITLWFIVLYKGTLSETTARHETIHFRQYNEMFVLGFLAIYFYDWLRAFWQMKKDLPFMAAVWASYYLIRFEQEAYANEDEANYLDTRPRHAWKSFAL